MQSFMQGFWSWVRWRFNENDALIGIVGTVTVVNLAFWGTALPLAFHDLYGKPKWLLRYKIQQDKNAPVDKGMWWSACRLALFNLIPLQLVFGYLFMYPGMVDAGCSFKVEDVPGLSRMMVDFMVFVMIQEVGFYYLHRLFHHPFLYKWVHKKHHTWTAPIGIASVYAHPLEHLIVNGTPNFAGVILMRSHILTFWIWIAYVMVETVLSHSGYHLPLQKSPEFHDYHHLKFHCNYGGFGLMDWIHGTDRQFKKSIEFKRHQVLFGLKPVSQLVPRQNEKQG